MVELPLGHGHDIGSYCVIGDFPPIRFVRGEGGYLLLWHAYGTAETNMHIRGLGWARATAASLLLLLLLLQLSSLTQRLLAVITETSTKAATAANVPSRLLPFSKGLNILLG